MDESFEKFWVAYPRKVSKKMAHQKWDRLNMTDELFAKIMSTLELYKKTPQWRNIEYIPHPSTWLHQERWEDEVKTSATPISVKYQGL